MTNRPSGPAAASPPMPSTRPSLAIRAVGVLLVLTGALWLGVGASAQTSQTTRTLVAEPATGLNAGSVVTVRFAGYQADRTIQIRQCPTGAQSASTCQNPQFFVSDGNGAGTGLYTVDLTDFCNATTSCELAAFAGTTDRSPARAAIFFSTSATTTTSSSTTSTTNPNATTTVPSSTTTAPTLDTCPLPTGELLRFSGGTSADPAFLRWVTEACQPGFGGIAAGIPVDYTGRSGAVGKRELLEGFAEVAISGVGFTADDAALLEEAERTPDDYVMVPITASAIACMFNVQYLNADANFAPLPELHIDVDAMAAMLATERDLSSPTIAAANADNPWYRYQPDGAPTPAFLETIARAEGAYATYLLTEWIASDPSATALWQAGGAAFTPGATEYMPAGFGANLVVGAYRAALTVRLWEIEKNRPGGKITCVDTSVWQSESADQAVAYLENPLGGNTYPVEPAIRRGIDLMEPQPDGTYRHVFTEADGFTDQLAYPLPVISYAIVPRYLTVETTDQIQAFLTWAVTEGQQDPNLPPGYVPLPDDVVETAKAKIAELDAPPATSTTSTSTTAAPAPTGGEGQIASGSGFVSSGSGLSGSSTGGGSSASGGSGSAELAGSAGGAVVATESLVTGDGEVDAPGGTSKPVVAVLSGDSAIPPIALILVGIFLLISGPVVARMTGASRTT